MQIQRSQRARFWCCLFLGLASGTSLRAEPIAKGKPTMLIEPADLQKQLETKEVRILDTRSQADYEKGHVPTATWVDVPAWQAMVKKPNGFHNVDAWSKAVGELGLDAKTRVVVYGDSLSNTARIWWMLKYAGLADVRMLNGGWDVWKAEGHPCETSVTTYVKSKFVPKFQADRLEQIETLKKNVAANKVKVVDTRSSDEFTGKEVRGKRGGHIPGATHLEWKELLAKDGRFKTTEQLQELFRKRGIEPEAEVVCY